jgi:hypothetical protein
MTIPDDSPLESCTRILNANRLIVLVYGPDGALQRCNSYTDPARALQAVTDATNDHERAVIRPAEPITEQDLLEPCFTAPRTGGASMPHLEYFGGTVCGLDRPSRERWTPVLDPAYSDVCPSCVFLEAANPEDPMPLTPPQFHAVLTGALDRASLWDRLLRRPIIRLVRPTVTIRGRVWQAVSGSGEDWGYTARQARQMRDALDQLMQETPGAEETVRFWADRLGL